MSCTLPRGRAQAGAVLATTLVLMVLALLVGLASARLAAHGQKAARFEADRQTALFAAEAALADAERDIAGPDSGAPGRQSMFATGAAAFGQHCGQGADDLGLCLASAGVQPPDWQAIDLADEHSPTVAFGSYTGARLPVDGASLPLRLPRYLIELLPDGPVASGTLYRVTAIGFGERSATQVVLQSVYHRGAAGPAPGNPGAGNDPPSGRLGWREVGNWPQLHKQAIQ